MYVRFWIFMQYLLLLRHCNLLVLQHLICSMFPLHRRVMVMFLLVFILIEGICVKIWTWSWLAGFKCRHPGESDALAMSASQGGSPSKKHLLSWRWTQERRMETGVLPTGGWTAQVSAFASCLCSSSAVRCSWKGRVLWIT